MPDPAHPPSTPASQPGEPSPSPTPPSSLQRILVLADTHNRLPPTLIHAAHTANAIWHLGDVCEPQLLQPLHATGQRLLVIRGNNDFEPSWPLEIRLRFGNRTFLLTHIPPTLPPDADVLLFGHTHVPCCQQRGRTWWLNPGTVGKPNKGAPPAFAWLHLNPATGTFTWHPQPL